MGAAAIDYPFAFAPLAPHLVLDVAFLRAEAQGSATSNDFLSVDLTQGATSLNVFFADTHAAFPATSTKYGLPMTAPERVHVDLLAAFPGLVAGAPLTVRVSVGNGGDGLNPSKGYVDALRLVPAASASFRNGLGRNQPRYHSSPAVLGGDWTVTVDTTGRAQSGLIQLVAHQRPSAGTLRASGELLVSGRKLFAQSWPAVPGLNARVLHLPPDFALLGAFWATQVTISGGGAELCNAYDLVLGF
jgi:hypothetical protein